MLKTFQKFRYATVAAVIAASALSGCVELDAATVGRESLIPICYGIVAANYGNAPASGAKVGLDELRRRGLFTDAELRNIAVGRVAPGMTEAAAICAMGQMYDHVNTTVTSGGTSRQLVYPHGGYAPTSYVYTRNGIVTAAQY